ncbi:PREDICTED: chromatin assembly factor 1 subunit FAS1-like [Camelina sativa]|uniref:Chromatin assembly factor 1 subunit FAS1-like n=1 Tax=Camelina sativa TaxID=90675 RepID=A0ABM0WFM3_CAMSA|nr:PREDICTED: chromatin assembly factor 1 subunit FAS1-like [Camelina sativa]
MEEVTPVNEIENQKTPIEPKKSSNKRKREPAAIENLTSEEKEAQISSLNRETKGLFDYFREMMEESKRTDLFSRFSDCSSVNSMVALLMEEMSLPLSKLVDEIYLILKEKVESVTLVAVKSAVVSVGQRVSYGLPNADADVLEDDSESCLWCWETRDLKMMPSSVRGLLKVRRTCRKKIHERITAVSAMLAALQRGGTEESCRSDLSKAAEKLGKILTEVDIRSFMDNMLQKNSAEMAEKDSKREEKLLLKQLEKSRCEAEKEKKRVERQVLKERLQQEKEQKLMQKAIIDENNKEKDETESRKRLKKQQDESEKEQKRREKEQAELKKQLQVQKQASIMERFLKKSKDSSITQPKLPSSEITAQEPSCAKPENESGTVIQAIDNAFSTTCEATLDDIRREHFASWRQLGHSLSSTKKHWGMRRQPKSELFPKLKLSTNREATSDGEPNMEKQVDGCEEKNFDGISSIGQCESSSSDRKKKSRRAKQLLQFDKSCRPGFYGIWPSQSQVVGPRRPLKKDPELDYEVDSDEEWEEEEAGESLSDCEKDEEESLEEGCSKADDEDDSEDDFMVPDGYLSEDEGVQVDRMDMDSSEQDASTPSSKQDQESQEFCALLQQQKHLQSLTDHALRKTQPLIICNLTHEKVPFLASKDLEGTQKVEQICLRALMVRAFPWTSLIEISINDMEEEDQETGKSSCSQSTPPSNSKAKSIPDSDLITVVSTIQSCPQGINRVVETLQQKFPDVPKTKLRQKVREISDFEDSRWQVKKEVLTKLGLSPSPDKSGKRPKMISTFFSKRCLPPSTKPQPAAVEEAQRLENENA